MATKIPQSPTTLLGRILADADLDYLGRTDFFGIGNKLKWELSATGSVMTGKEWNDRQLDFMEKHPRLDTRQFKWVA